MIGVGLSKRFMRDHPRDGESTFFGASFLEGSKRHTIRRDPNGRYKDGMEVQVYQWSGLLYRSPWEVLGVRRIGVVPVKIYPDARDVEQVGLRLVPMADVAGNDGLVLKDFKAWFFDPKWSVVFIGVILHFDDFRY